MLMEKELSNDLKYDRIEKWVAFEKMLILGKFGEKVETYEDTKDYKYVKKAYSVISFIRSLVLEIFKDKAKSKQTEEEYCIGLLYYTLTFLTFPNVNIIKKLFAVQSASMILKKIEELNK